MKRNNIFMWAYISFIIFSAFLRLFREYSLWHPIVLAITISSVFFAFEDLFVSLYHSLKDSLDVLESFLLEERMGYDKDKELFQDTDKKMERYNLKSDLWDEDSYELLNINFRQVNELLCTSNATVEARKKRLNRYRNVASLWSYFGFLCLFCTLIVATHFVIPEIVQEIFTVIPFALILITQQIKTISAEKNKEDLDETTNALEVHAEASRELIKVKSEIDDLIAEIESEPEEVQHAN